MNSMNIHKHMEAIFVVALAVIGFGTVAVDSMGQAGATPSAQGAHGMAAAGRHPVVAVCATKAGQAA